MKNIHQINKKIEDLYIELNDAISCFELSEANVEQVKERILGAISALKWAKSTNKRNINWEIFK